MTDEGPSLKPALGRFGVWTGSPVTPEQAVEIEKLGYGAVWVGASPAADLAFVEPILEQTQHLQVATGIVNIWTAEAAEVAESYHRIEKAFPGRFLLGVGVGHPEHTQEYTKPYQALVEYLDALDAAKVPTSRMVIAALGPEGAASGGAAQRGCAPVPDHAGAHRPGARTARSTLSRSRTQGGADRRRGQGPRDRPRNRRLLLGLSNYVNNWKRLGFTDGDLTSPGSDRFIERSSPRLPG